VFAEEGLGDLGLEEIEYDDTSQCWLISIDFTTPWVKAQAGGIHRSILAKKRTQDRKDT
jgi:hypothetical protein